MRLRTRGAQSRALAALAVAASLTLALTAGACGGGAGLFRQYEYEEEMYLALDGSATMYVNASIAALNALRGTDFDASPSARIDRDRIRDYFTSPVTHVTRVSSSRRSNRRFVHVRLDVDDVRRLADAAPFAWSAYRFDRDGDHYVFHQTVGAPAAKDGGAPGWTGAELVAFRLHLPSKIDFHNTGHEIGRGNILVWEQPLGERLHGAPLAFDARMQTQSILYRTLWLFAVTFVAVAAAFAVLLWWLLARPRGAGTAEQTERAGG